MRPCPPCARRSRGFTLIELVVVILVLGVLVTMASVVARGVTAAQKRSLTATRMATVDAAIVQYVLQQKRLPCPADGRKASSVNDAGLEKRNAAGQCETLPGTPNSFDHGVVPWRTLALTELEATDGWDRRLTYRVARELVVDNGMDMSWCDPAGTAAVGGAPNFCTNPCAASTCTSPANFLANKGLPVQNVAGTVLMNPNGLPNTGAAYVVISHGESGGGGYLNTGQLGTTSSADGTEELKNYASLPYTVGVTYYVDDSTNDTAGNTHFDDVLSRPAILAVISKAGLAPRAR